ncbi:hypothetical protein [Candidatus Harpocratesius sp.]
MKKKNKIILLSILFLIAVSSTNFGVADLSLSTNTTITIEGTEQDDSYTRLALISAKNTINDIYVSGNKPGMFSFTDKYGNPYMGYPIISNDIRQYPQYIGSVSYFSSNYIDPWEQVNWMKVENATELDGETPRYNISMKFNNIGEIAPNEISYFRLDAISMLNLQFNLIVNQKGLHILYFDHDDVSTIIALLSPSGNHVDFSFQNLPEVAPGGDPYRTMLIFTADELGLYQLNFIPKSKDIILELQEISPTSKIEYGSYITYKSEDYDKINPGSLQSKDSLPIQSYAINVEANQILNYNFDFIWGQASSAYIQLAIPTPNGYDLRPIVADGEDHAEFISYSGTAYLQVIYRDFYYWAGSIPVRDLCYYNFNINLINPSEYTLGSTQLLEISVQNPNNVWKFHVNESVSAYLNVSIIAGNPKYTLDSAPSSSIYYKDSSGNVHTCLELSELYGAHLYSFDPGDYYIFFTHSGIGINNEYVELKSVITKKFADLAHKNLTINDKIIAISEKSRYSLDHIASIDGDGSFLEPFVVNFTYEDPILFGVNLSIVRADNSDFENYPFRIRFKYSLVQLSKFDNFTYIDSNSGQSSSILLDTDEEESVGINQYLFEDSSLFISKNGKGLLAIWPYQAEIDLGSGFVSYNDSLDVRVCSYSSKDTFKIHSISEISEVNRQIGPSLDYDTVYYTTISSINISQTNKILIDVNASRQFDWYQFILNSNMSASGILWIALLYNNVWSTISGPGTNNQDFIVFGSSNANQSFELGIAPKTFKIYIQFTDPASEVISYRFRLSHYNLTVLHSPIYTPDYKAPLPKWVLPASIGGGAAVIVAGAVILIIKKRKRF